MTSEAEKRASRKYDQKMVVQIGLRLNRKTDADIIGRLNQLERSKMGYIKEAVREKMKREDR